MPRHHHQPSGRCVPGIGPVPCDWFVLGEAPGPSEDIKGEPFVGKTGDEMHRWFDGDDLPDFVDTYRTNVYKVWKGQDVEYDASDLVRDEPILLQELHDVQPKVIVAVGRHAARYLLGDISLDETHGLAWYLPTNSKAAEAIRTTRSEGIRRGGNGRRKERESRSSADIRTDTSAGAPSPVVVVTYHPAAGFRSPEASALVAYDFQQLALFARGDIQPRHLFDDPIPHPIYTYLQGKAQVCLAIQRL